MEKKNPQFQQLRDNIYIVVYDWPSRVTGSIGKDGSLMVDANLKDNFPIIHRAIDKNWTTYAANMSLPPISMGITRAARIF